MAWTLEYDVAARRQLRKLDPQIGARVGAVLLDVSRLADPRVRGKALTGQWSGHWRYRVGDYRVIAKIEDGRMVIVVVTLGHRRDIYR